MSIVRRPAVADRPIVLTIGTSEPLVSAGVLLDLLMADRLEIRPLAVITAVSAQDGLGQFLVESLSVDLVRAQLQAYRDLPIAAVRLGAIPNIESMVEIAQFLRIRAIPAILDPVLVTSAGGELLDDEALSAMQVLLFPHVRLVTPNLDECARLSGYEVSTVAEMDAAALKIVNSGAHAVLIKGGHLGDTPVDVFWDGEDLYHYQSTRLEGDMRGTGCALAISITAALAHGHELRKAIRAGREIVRHLISVARPMGVLRVVP